MFGKCDVLSEGDSPQASGRGEGFPSNFQLPQRDPTLDQPLFGSSIFGTASSDQKWRLNMRPKQTEDFLQSPPPESFFSRTFKKPVQKASTSTSAASKSHLPQHSRIQSKESDVLEPAEELPQLRHQSEAQTAQMQEDGRSKGISALNSQIVHGLNSGQLPDLAADPLRIAERADQARGGQEAASGAAEEGVSIRPRHERVASLNAWSQETVPNITATESRLEANGLATDQSDVLHADGKSQKRGHGSFGYQNAEAGSFDFKPPPVPNQAR